MQVVGWIVVTAIGLIQIVATADGCAYATGLPNFFSYIVAVVLTAFPVIGAIAGVYGATEVWGWDWYWAVALFIWPVVLMAVLAGGAGMASWVQNRSRQPRSA
jgi:hypothetical protein